MVSKASDDTNSNSMSLPKSNVGGMDEDIGYEYVNDSWLENASEDELRSVEKKMRSELDQIDYDSDEYLQLDLKRIDIVNAITSRFPINLPHREHGWYLPNDD